MQTIAISIDDATLAALDRVAAAGSGRSNRSQVVRMALREYIEHRERTERETRETEILAAHSELINAQARALLEEQAPFEAQHPPSEQANP